ncbi:MAG: hypothetical protein WCO12_03860 [bacterium]
MNKSKAINLVENLGWMDLPEADRDALLEKTGDLIFQKVLARVMEKLDEEDKLEFEKMFEGDVSDEEVLNFLRSKIPDVDDVVRGEITEFLQDADDVMSAISI